MMYKVKYKCLHCDNELTPGDPVNITPEEADTIIMKVIKHQQFINNPYLYQAPMFVTHRCTDGSVCLAQFIGFVKICN